MKRELSARIVRVVVVILTLITVSVPAGAQSPNHPLDALTAREYWTIFDALKASRRVDAETRYARIELREPPKRDVLTWKAGDPFPREALVVVKQGRQVFEAVVDVRARKLTSWSEIKDVILDVLPSERSGIEDAIKASPEWKAAMARRGVTDFETIDCYFGVLGYFGTREEQNRRLARAMCADRRGTWTGQGREFSGLVTLVDLDAKQVIRVIDTGSIPLPPGTADYDVEAVGPVRDVPTPIIVEQPQGPSFKIDGQVVSWQKWRFHFRIDSRHGVVVSDVRYDDGGRLRPVLYQGSLSEIFVPYMDPDETWYFISFLDVGEHGPGFATSLDQGSDCPENAVFFDAIHADDRGIPQRRRRAACLFERYSGDPMWRHATGPDQIDSRRRRDLVLRMVATIGNYDYLVDWVFVQDGTIRVVSGATGQVNVKAVSRKNPTTDEATGGRVNGASDNGHHAVQPPAARPPASGAADAYGRFVAPNVVAVNHDHFLSFRLDVDVDGPANSFEVDRLTARKLPADSPRRSLWVVEPSILRTESEGRLHMSMDRPALWRVINPSVRGAVGYSTSYHIKPGHTAMSLLSDDDNPQLRAGFSKYSLWVSKYDENEKMAVGPYPTGARRAGGLPQWTAANRSIENTDLVVWYTMGMHHVPRAEDWPVMPVSWHEVELRPFDFFSRNPALDLPKRH